jgi:translation initiation factor 6
MPLATGDLMGTSQVGVHIAAVGKVIFVPIGLPKEDVEALEASLGLESVPFSIGGSALLGSLIIGNSNGIAVADIASEEDIDKLCSYGDVVVMESSVNAAGNLLVANDKGILASPVLPVEGLEILSETLKVPCKATSIAGDATTGSLAVANNRGVLVHPDVTEAEVTIVEKVLGVPAMVGTVNFGSPYVGAGCISTDEGAWVGAATAGPELNRIEDALDLI